jgi:glycosyltransferase involved in cell wall biosynthesis
MSNILFALYHDFSANSAVHVHNFANHLALRGHRVAVAIPHGDNVGAGLGEQNYSLCTFADVDGDWSRLFHNAGSPDILHAWTPRENVRLFCEKVASLCACTLFIHLEDNEELILEANLGVPFEEISRASTDQLPANLANPRRYRAFIAAAAGVTIIMDRLGKFVPETTPKLILWPGADRELFRPVPRDEHFLASLGVPPGAVVLCYTGNVHSANAREVRSLYLAAAILARKGVPTVLVRAGRDFCSFLGPDESWARHVSVDLGYVKHVRIPALLSLADALVQPGADDAFNEYRLPAKLPEFFAMGLPVILPKTNVGRFVQHGEHAWVLEKVDALGIVDAIQLLRRDETLRERLSRGALAFCEQHFDWTKNTDTLVHFYERVIAGREERAHLTATGGS